MWVCARLRLIYTDDFTILSKIQFPFDLCFSLFSMPHTSEDVALTYIDSLQARPNLNDNQLRLNTLDLDLTTMTRAAVQQMRLQRKRSLSQRHIVQI